MVVPLEKERSKWETDEPEGLGVFEKEKGQYYDNDEGFVIEERIVGEEEQGPAFDDDKVIKLASYIEIENGPPKSEEGLSMANKEFLEPYLKTFEERLTSIDNKLESIDETQKKEVLQRLTRTENNVSWILKFGIPLVAVLGGGIIWLLQQILKEVLRFTP